MIFTVAIYLIIAAVIITLALTSAQRVLQPGKLRELRAQNARLVESRDLARKQLRVAKKALTDEQSAGSLNAQLALEDISRLQTEHDEQRELEA
jgi:hypothetical protein